MTDRGIGNRVADHVELLRELPGFDSLDLDTKQQLGNQFDTTERGPGETLIVQGEPSPGLFILLEGHVSISQSSAAGRVLLNELGPGAIFGEMSFVRDGGVAGATVSTTESVRYAILEPHRFAAALAAHPQLADAISSNSLFRHRANLLSQVFHSLDAPSRRSLADSIEAIDVTAGTVLVRQGEPGRRAYVIAAGTADVILETAAGPKALASLGAGSLIGEGSLLTDSPRDASVVMTSPGRVLALSREDLLSAAGDDGTVSPELVSLLRMRWRPQQRPGIEVKERTTPEGDTIVTLKDPARNAYYRMAADGAFIWHSLDGQTTLRDIAMGYLQEFGRFAPQRVAEAVHDLVAEGFATAAAVSPDLEQDEAAGGPGTIVLRTLGNLAWTKGVEGIDEWFGRLHRFAGFLFTRPAVALLSIIALSGIVLSVAVGPRSGDFITEAGGSIVLLGLIPANALGAIWHELAHGLAVKHFGRTVNRAGVGWYLITPIAFVDTSDMWLEDRTKRALVSVAGPFANLVLAGTAAIAATLTTSPLVTALLWQFVVASFYLALINMNPLLEFDGYYILADYLDRPTLRDDALRWIGTELPGVFRDRSKLKGHRIDLVYGLLALAYIVLVGYFMLIVYRLMIEGVVAKWLPAAAASGLAWVFALGVALVAALATWAQMRGLNAPRH